MELNPPPPRLLHEHTPHHPRARRAVHVHRRTRRPADDAADAAAVDDAADRDAPARSSRSVLRPLVLRLHFYAGVLVAPFLLVAAPTGLLYAASVPGREDRLRATR